MAPRKLYSFWIDPDLLAALRARKADLGVNESETIRRAIREFLERRGAMPRARGRKPRRR